MDIKNLDAKKKKFLALAFILSILGGAWFYFFQSAESNTLPDASVPRASPLPNPAAQETDDDGTQQASAEPYELTPQPSPFATPPANTAASAPPVNTGTIPNIPEMPAMPPIPSNMMPGIPDGSAFPANNPAFPFEGNKIQVVGIVIGSNKTAILSNGQQQITVKEGANCQWGTVDSINKNGVTLNGEYIAINRQVNKR